MEVEVMASGLSEDSMVARYQASDPRASFEVLNPAADPETYVL